MRLSLGYPDFSEEMAIIERQELTHPIDSLEPVATPEEVTALQEAAKEVYVDRLVRQYIVSLTESTRNHRDIALGASPRATLGLFRIARAMALVQDRDYVIPDDVKSLATGVLSHPWCCRPRQDAGHPAEELISDLLNQITVPGMAQVWVDGRGGVKTVPVPGLGTNRRRALFDTTFGDIRLKANAFSRYAWFSGVQKKDRWLLAKFEVPAQGGNDGLSRRLECVCPDIWLRLFPVQPNYVVICPC